MQHTRDALAAADAALTALGRAIDHARESSYEGEGAALLALGGVREAHLRLAESVAYLLGPVVEDLEAEHGGAAVRTLEIAPPYQAA